ncbi:MAG: ABC transporter ATP-binding protein [Clostridia bacterium]|nr:ABC transporter ATP-binding protein [Clostridia bacterium]
MIEVKDLCRKYGKLVAVDGLSFTVDDGEIYGFLGPNGAGKSTTLNMITGCLAPTSGKVTVGGHDIFEEPVAAKRSMGYLPEIPPVYPNMTVREYLTFVARAKGLKKKSPDGKDIKSEIARVGAATGVDGVLDRVIRNLSKGYRQRVGIAQALLGDPDVVILDEPTVGLDPAQIKEIRELIKSLGGDHTVLLSSHILSEVSAICDHILIISGGKLVACDTPENLEASFVSASVLDLTVKGDPAALGNALEPFRENGEVTLADNEDGTVAVRLTSKGGEDLREEVSRAMAQNGVMIFGMSLEKASLEDVFMELTAEEDREAGLVVAPDSPVPDVDAREKKRRSRGFSGRPDDPGTLLFDEAGEPEEEKDGTPVGDEENAPDEGGNGGE